ncbi:FxsA family protein [Sulfurospirillum barnesii]|uniref:Protein affecting phage T7 exclusion by the F plasmid n=1 Tax=Sulfurospirillum barnesii (strain ATCC 700032 / DSM 10660 / SES-3) TaxID=760154 RepID=I3XXK0_SULBS|nr:FxsA family protein [Sulfurospirillum barnesii]AFL68674.1 protein affecting phage T7 exclusion by the F plasmid [Sulfurospirillum barnesii SES-3]
MKYFLIYLFLEVMVSVNIASVIGAFSSFIEIIFSAIIGFVLLANMRMTLMQNMNALMQGEISLESFERLNLWALFGAFLLILPGFLSDIVGLLLQFSAFATLMASKFLHVNKQTPHFEHKRKHLKEEEIIDVEVIDDPHAK